MFLFILKLLIIAALLEPTNNLLKRSKAFAEVGGSQCGFCSPGMIIAAQSLLSHNPHPTEEEIKAHMSGNLCRCTGYQAIVQAVEIASKKGAGLW